MFPYIRTKCILRYLRYFKSFSRCPSKKVCITTEIVRENVRTTMGLNLLNICLETKIYSWSVSVSNIKKILTNKKRMGDTDVWKCWLLQEYTS